MIKVYRISILGLIKQRKGPAPQMKVCLSGARATIAGDATANKMLAL